MLKLRRHIVILIHEAESYDMETMLIGNIMMYLGWRYRYTICRGISRGVPPCDMVIIHTDLTVVPQEYLDAVADHPLVINRHLTDISKVRFSQSMLTQDADYEGQVIVKTNENCGGLKEFQLRGRPKEENECEDWASRTILREYPVFDSIKDVPKGVWENQRLIVEKFTPERDEEGHYLLRIWIFMGDQEIHFVNFSKNPVVKRENKIRREELEIDEVPQELRKIRSMMKADYGKFDYVLCDGKPILYDINKTPSGGRIGRGRSTPPVLRSGLTALAQGVKDYFEKA